jgi:hypothetical protein
MKAKKIIRNVLLGILGFFLLLLITVQIILSPRFLTRMVNKYAADYVDGTVHVDKVRASVFRSFPNLNLLADGLSITYPHDKFAQYDSLCTETGRFALVNRGRGEVEDTLASIRKLDVSVNALAFLDKKVDIRRALVYSPRVFAHYYDSTAANWDIIKIESSEDTTSKSGDPMPIIVRKAGLLERPYVVYTNPKDTLHALIAMKDIVFKGNLNTADILHTRWGLDIDSLFVSGRLPADTLALGLDHLGLHGGSEALVLDAQSKAHIASATYGRMALPIGLLAQGSLPDREDGAVEVKVDTAALNAASLVLQAQGDVILRGDRTTVNASAKIDDCPLTAIANDYGALIPELRKIHTNAILSLQANCEGDFVPAENRIPDITARLRVPRTDIAYEDIPYRGYTEIDLSAATDEYYKLNVDVQKLMLDVFGVTLNLKGGVDDTLGGDPFIDLYGGINADLAAILDTFTAEDGITGTGTLSGTIGASSYVSRLSAPGGISNIDLSCRAKARYLRVYDRPDSITAFIPSGTLTFRTIGKDRKTLGINAFLDTLSLRSGKNMSVRGHGVSINTNNLVKLAQGGPQAISASLKAHRLAVRDKASISALLSDLSLGLAAKPHASVTRANSRRQHYLDSLQRVYPGVPRDSIIAVMRRSRRLPVWMQEEEFRQHDIDISVGEGLARYVRDWDFSGSIGLDRGRFRIPDFPLANRVSSLGGTFSNDQVVIDSLTLQSGESDISANVNISGLRRALLRKGLIRVDANVTSEYIDANEIMRAYAWSQTEGMDKSVGEEIKDAEIPDSVKYALIVVPGNLIANIGLEANQIKYDSLMVTWAASDIAIKQRTMQITNTVATSNMGDIYFEGFYSTIAKDDIKAGFDLNLVDVTAEKVINLFPALDTITPMLKSFGGFLDCEVAATSELDTNMNFITSSIDGIMKISGKDLSIRNSKEFRRIASLLLFRNRREAVIDNMSVTGMIRDNTLEVFPFVLSVDRYMLAASGIQNMDESFRYHFSVIKSPVLVKFGVNLWGPDFNNIKWGLGWPKYRSANVPVFTSQIHDVQYNLVGSIHNIFDIGVEKAMEENRNQNLIADEMARLNYSSEIDTTENAHFRDSVMTLLKMHEDPEESIEERLERLRNEVLTEEENASQKGDMKKDDDDVQQ